MALHALCDKMKGKLENKGKGKKIEGVAVLLKKNVLNSGDCKAPVFDRFAEILGNGISFQLVSSTHTYPGHFLLFIFSLFLS